MTPPPPDVGADRIADCPLHGDNARKSVRRQIVMVDIVEALRHYDVPNDMVKVLRKYHAFLTEANDASDVKEERNRKAIDNFMKKFEEMVSSAFANILAILYLFYVFFFCRI